jgi:hypothetical protein
MRFTTQWFSAAGRLWCAIASESREEKKETAGNDKEEKSDGLLLENCFLASSSKLATAFQSNGDLQNQVSTPLQDFPVSVFCLAIIPYLCFNGMQIYLFSVHAR